MLKSFTLALTLAVAAGAAPKSHWDPPCWCRYDSRNQAKSQGYYNQHNGWDDHRGTSLRFDNNGNGVVVPEQVQPWNRLNWNDYDVDGDGKLSPEEWSRMRLDLHS